jgi:hypothetical protein
MAKFMPCHPDSQSVVNAYRASIAPTRRFAATAATQRNSRPSRTAANRPVIFPSWLPGAQAIG